MKVRLTNYRYRDEIAARLYRAGFGPLIENSTTVSVETVYEDLDRIEALARAACPPMTPIGVKIESP